MRTNLRLGMFNWKTGSTDSMPVTINLGLKRAGKGEEKPGKIMLGWI